MPRSALLLTAALALAAAPLRAQEPRVLDWFELERRDAELGFTPRSDDDALARLCDPLVTELTSGSPERIKICDNDRCRWVFYDTSRTGRRRWCDMATCGNRAKAARHRARSKAGAAGESAKTVAGA